MNILIVGTEPLELRGLEEKLKALKYESCYRVSPECKVAQLASFAPELVFLGPNLDERTLQECLHKLKIIDTFLPILVFSENHDLLAQAAGITFQGIHAIRPDATMDDISKIMKEALEQKTESAMGADFPALIGESEQLWPIRRKIQKVADKDITVLITGESGTGKELIARSIHFHSARSKGPLVKINCGALPDELLESEVFGFQKGAFTGAHRNKPGRFEMAEGGTLFVDEIGDLSLSLQVKFLQVLEEKVLSRLGGTRDRIVDTRVLAATNSDLTKKVREGSFRKDLYYRLNVAHIKAPSLRERKADIPLLIHYFLNKYCYEFRKDILDVPPEIAEFLMGYHWPGNVRELENLIRRAIVMRDWRFVFEELKPLSPGEESESPSDNDSSSRGPSEERIAAFFKEEDFSLKKLAGLYVSQAESEAILRVLKETGWNRKKTARLLQVSYKTLLNRIDAFGLKP